MKEKRIIPLLAICWVLAAAPAWSGNFDVGININIGAPVRVPIIVPEPPLFLAPAPLGFQIAVGVPYDLCIVDERYYLLYDNVWHVGPGYNGPWQVLRHDHLPPGLRKHNLRKIRLYRDREYVIYNKDKDHYRGRSYRPERHDHQHYYDRDRYRRRWSDHNRERDHDHDHDWNRQRRTDYDRKHDHDRDWDQRGDDDRGQDHAQNRYRYSDERADRVQRHDRGHGKGNEKWKERLQ